jgi:Calpain family cysteine protease
MPMPLTAPILPLLFDGDPAVIYEQIAATLTPGQKWTQDFDYSIIELPQCNDAKYLEDSFPNSPVTDFDGDLDSWEITQGSLGACGTFANIACYASFPQSSPWAVEKGIYPLTPSPIGLYLIRVCDPKSPLTTKWLAIDSKVPCENTPSSKSTCIWLTDGQTPLLPALLTKAAATMKGGSFNEITNHPSFSLKFDWFPAKSVSALDPSKLIRYAQNGAIWVISMTQQFDDLGNKISPPGIVYQHAFGVVDGIEGNGYQLFRIENPWGGGLDYVSQYSDDAPFWDSHLELAQKKADSFAATGNFWVDFETLKKLSGRTVFILRVPLF